MKKIGLIIIAILLVLSVSSQDNISKLDFKVGAGVAFMGLGDSEVISFENEFNYKINNYITTSISMGIGRSIDNKINHNDYIQGSLNMFISPFRNDKKNNFKLGAGYTLISETRAYSSNGINELDSQYSYHSRTLNAFSIIIEDEYLISEKFLIGAKLFSTASISQGGIVGGAMLKLGILL